MHRENVSTANLPTDAQHAGGFDFLLACKTDFGQNQVPRVAADFVIVQFHNQSENIAVQRRTKSSQRQQMKKPISIWVAVICLGVLCQLGCERSEMTNAQVVDMFEKAGGVDKISQEAKIIFDRFGTNESKVIFGPDLTNFPALSLLGKPLFLQNNSSNWSAHIEIPFGTHSQRNFIFIFNAGSPIEFPYASRCIQAATNIFVGK